MINPTNVPFSWFRLNIKEVAGNAPSDEFTNVTKNATSMVNLGEVTLSDEAGIRQNVGLVEAAHVYEIKPGEVSVEAYHSDRWGYWYDSGYELYKMFDHLNKGTNNLNLGSFFLARHRVAYNCVPVRDDPTSWASLVMRVTNNTPAIASYDLVIVYPPNANSTAAERKGAPVVFGIEGSVDGLLWEDLHDTGGSVRALETMTGNYKYTSDPTVSFASGHPERAHTGFLFSQTNSTAAGYSILGNDVSVAPGATLVAKGSPLTIGRLSVGASGGGTLDGFAFAADGELSVATGGADAQRLFLPMSFTNSTGLANLQNWSLTVDGKSSSARIVAASDGLAIIKKGISITVR